ncbi:LuxR family transcriptional regulator [Catenulispora yoronensis]|uniref:LuxR family transcriptional regulator n=1 Tax=Catenulispora yoronensis TaxID=450799 RepID=A0ABN2TWR5_9ACTN
MLLARTVERAAERMLVLQARGFETEAEIGYSVLADLCRPLGDEIDELPELLREALLTATGAAASSGEGSSAFAVGRALTVLLQNVAAHQPVLIALDDGHWADEASAYALAFAARRLGDAATAVLITLRNGEPSVFDGLDVPSVELSPLERTAAEALIGAEAARRVGPRMAEHIHRAGQGNPLALLELADAALSGRLDPDDDQVVPSGSRLEHAFATRLKRLPERCTRALMVVATSYTGGLAETAGAMERLGISEFDLDLARMEHLVWEEEDRWQMRHPVFRSVAYQHYPIAERRRAHRAFADWLADNGGGVGGTFLADQRAWHAAAAALPGDEEAATLLAEAADAARSRGALAAARRAYLRTRELSAEPGTRAAMSLGAAECAQVSGDVETAQVLAREALRYAQSPDVTNAANRVLHQITLARAGAEEVLELFEADADALAEHESDLAASYLGAAGATAITATRLHDTVRLSAKGVALTPSGVGTGAAAARTISAFGLVSTGRAAESAAVIADYFPAFREADPWRQSFETVGCTGMVLIWLGLIGQAGEYVTRTARLLRQAGAEEHLPLLLIPQVLLSIRKGELTAAHEAAEESRRLGGELGQRQVAPLAVALAARLAVVRGNFTRARDLATTTEQLTEATGASFYRDIANTAVGSADLAQGRYQEAVSVLSGVRERLLAGGMVEHSLFMPTFGDYIEALTRIGADDRARAEVAEELPRAEAGGLQAALAVVYRCQAQVLSPCEARPWFDRAMAAHAVSVDAFEQARTQLAYGRFLREDGERDAADRLLTAAVTAFTGMGADAWLEEAETELDLLALPVELSGARLAGQERRVMRLAAEGATNGQISEALGIAPQTVDRYLEQVFDKLGVRQRSELAGLLQRGTGV